MYGILDTGRQWTVGDTSSRVQHSIHNAPPSLPANSEQQQRQQRRRSTTTQATKSKRDERRTEWEEKRNIRKLFCATNTRNDSAFATGPMECEDRISIFSLALLLFPFFALWGWRWIWRCVLCGAIHIFLGPQPMMCAFFFYRGNAFGF